MLTIMKKVYHTPSIQVIATTTCQMIANSIKVGGTVSNGSDIGFVKGEGGAEGSEEFWDNERDW